jgi:pimeloyl-[acyl-carrier protein] methyl ester esterase
MQVVLLPGFDGSGQLFDAFRAQLSADWSITVVRYEQALQLQDYVSIAAAALPMRDAVIVAESFSGPIALELLARYSERIRCAVLCASFARPPMAQWLGLTRFVPEVFLRSARLRRAVVAQFCLNGVEDPALIAKVNDVVADLPVALIRSRFAALATMNAQLRLAEIRTPILYLRAKRDLLVSASASRQLTVGLTNCSVHDVDGPHLLLQANAGECAAAVRSFVDSA